MDVERAITVGRSPAEVYACWRDFENLPLFMYHLLSVENSGGGRSHWVTKGPSGRNVEWDAEIVEDRPGELISWRTIGRNDDIEHTGSVSFISAPGDRGTEVRVMLSYDPPGGKLGVTLAKLFGEEPGQQITDDLRRFKQVIEVGEATQRSSLP